MAGSVAMQAAIFGSPVLVGRSNWARGNLIVPTPYTPRLRRMATTAPLRCVAEGDLTDNKEDQEMKQIEPPKIQPPPAPKVSTKFSDVMAFGGPAPERINGRLAMIGFVAAMAVELSKNQDLFTQLSNGGVAWFAGTSVVLTLASLIPMFKGVNVESKSDGLMTSNAELWNGRFAMLGLIALAFTEYVKGGALV